MSNVKLGLIPRGTKVNVFPPCGSDLDDDHTAVVGVCWLNRLVQRLNDVALYAEFSRS